MYCAVKEDKAILGNSKEEIVSQIFQWQLNPHNILVAKCKGYKERAYHSYSMDVWTKEEIRQDVVKFLFNKLRDFDYMIFTEYK